MGGPNAIPLLHSLSETYDCFIGRHSCHFFYIPVLRGTVIQSHYIALIFHPCDGPYNPRRMFKYGLTV
jgi:hypothetical protein